MQNLMELPFARAVLDDQQLKISILSFVKVLQL